MRLELFAPISGKVYDIATSSDEVFANKIAGEGVYIIPEPNQNQIVSPCDGQVVHINKHQHAMLIQKEDVTILIHVGIDSVMMKGECFDLKVNEGDTVRQGDVLMHVDYNLLKESYKTDTILTIVEPLSGVTILTKAENVKAHNKLIEVEV